jgi:hypothetical protein
MEKQTVKKQEAQLAKNTLTELLTLYSPTKCLRKFKEVNTIQKSIELKLPSLVRYKKEFGEEKIESVIKLWLVDLNNCLNLRRPMSESNIDLIAFYIVSDFGNLTLPDIHLVFTRAKKGLYGELYESLNSAKVLGWFKDYFEERLEIAGEMTILAHNNRKVVSESRKKQGDKNPMNLSIKDLNEAVKGLNEKK